MSGINHFFRAILLLILLCTVVTYMKAIELMNHADKHVLSQEMIGNVPVTETVSIAVDSLAHEKMFRDTLKDCIPANSGEGNQKECKTYVVEGSKERIALMMPPGKMTDKVVEFLQIVLAKGKKGNDGQSAASQMEIVVTPHMAPYGYGKTHGYTRIIRIVPQPLLLGATDTLQTALKSSSMPFTLENITMNDLKASLRQQIRYHCRLNHIAAHTAIWTLGLEDFADVGKDWLVEKAQEFLGLNPDQEDLLDEVLTEYNKLDGADDKVIDTEEGDSALDVLNHMFLDGSRVMNEVRRPFIMQELDKVLLAEMKISNNLTDWPCQSFWTVGEPEDNLKLSPVIARISKEISPDCDAPLVSCWVKRDKCEAEGDGKCQ